MGTPLTHICFFSGIGGFALAARRVGLQTIQFCEIEPFCRAVLARNFPGVPIDHDITKFDGKPFRGRCFLLSGGFPCQDISAAGKGAGLIEGKRSSLWFDLYRIIGEIRPSVVLIENVPVLRSRGADRVLQDLAEAGYTADAFVVGADDIGASHRRKRVWIVAYDERRRCNTAGKRVWMDGMAEGRQDDSSKIAESDTRMAHTDAARQPQPGRTFANVRGWDQHSGEAMANPNGSGRLQRGGTEPGGEELSSSECDREAVADAAQSDRSEQGRETSGCRGRGETVADAARQQTGGLLLPAVSANSGRNCPDFPPGPGGDWSNIPAEFWPVEQQVCDMDDGLSGRLVRRRGDAGKRAAILRGLGNAIVPQVAELFMRWIVQNLAPCQNDSPEETTV